MTPISKVLVANRGEIAVRIIRTARAMGYRTVSVYSEADANALHVDCADQAVCIGPAAAEESYLAIDKLLHAAERSGADAIHPGYGFLAENADFAIACRNAGLIFVGPSAAAIELMGSKRLSKLAMQEAGVPCIPGYQGDDQSDSRLVSEAGKIGFPLMVKASAGGGGKGMRLVESASELEVAIGLARSEAQKAFGNAELILEKALVESRHIEIQVFADCHGNVVHLGERDCSIQRRHQKVVEESPSPFVDEALRERMGKAATDAAEACNYRGAGTVEFLVDQDKNFYFLEMNTRLQVEHPVTELVTGQDLVAWQLLVASGEPLPLLQDDIVLTGHAMEVRLYAEDPRKQFMPQTGRIFRWDTPESDNVRTDHGIRVGQHVSPHYDPMLAKIIAFGDNRDEARRRLACAVEDTVLLGVNSNKQFLSRVLRNQGFASGDATTAFIEKNLANDSSLQPTPPNLRDLGLAGILFLTRSNQYHYLGTKRIGWRNTGATPVQIKLQTEGENYDLALCACDDNANICFTVSSDGESTTLGILSVDDQKCIYTEEGMRQVLDYAFDGERLFIDTGSGNQEFVNTTHELRSTHQAAGNNEILAAMDGAIVDVLVSEGDAVEHGQTVVILEAMKMEHQLKAEVSGVVESVNARKGDQVSTRQLLVEIAAHDTQCVC
ncbi:MAG: acetyl/propionyl/methylcrotonyl-CoA carboxylase subunit alpha [Gammaproteobacteria bacterium]|nr:acetyl/propionyl/methylcrotonyl-CoA carboxylase subunit alpha [Gammaproteobacteria bacterium]